jgi:hypothetical protein
LSFIILMKLIPEVIPNNINLDVLEKFKIKTSEKSIIYSDEGIFSIQKKVLNKHNIKDGQYAEVVIDSINFIKDYSVVSYEPYMYKLPFNYKKKSFNEHIYGINKGSALKLVIEEVNTKILNVYFISNEDCDNFFINEDIVTFLSLLK